MDPEITAARQAKEEKQRVDQLAAKRHQDMLDKLDALGNSNLQVMQSFVAYLNKRISKTEVTNQLESINTPDALKLIPVLEKIEKTVNDKAIDWKPVTEALKPIADELAKIPKEHADAAEMPEIDYDKMANLFSSAIEKLAAPVVKVSAPIVNVPKADAPVINTEKVDLKPFVNEVSQVLTDFRVWTQDQLPEPVDLTEVEDLLKKSNDFLKKIEKKNFGGGGGGGGYVFQSNGTPSNPGSMVAPTLDASGAIPTGGLLSGIAYDDIVFSNEDGNSNPQTATVKYNTVTVRVLGMTYNASSKLTRIYKVS